MSEPGDKSLANSRDVGLMFSDIASEYDRLNGLFTFGIDRLWRKKAVRMIAPERNMKVLDIATGTGDFAFDLLRVQQLEISGIDISERMVEVCNKKIREKQLESSFQCMSADVTQIPFQDNSFDIVTIAFGFRNFADPEISVREIARVLKSGGVFMVLEFFNSKTARNNILFRFYMKRILPFIGRIVSGHPWAYKYLFDSIQKFYSDDDFTKFLKQHHFSEIRKIRLTFGIAHIFLCRNR